MHAYQNPLLPETALQAQAIALPPGFMAALAHDFKDDQFVADHLCLLLCLPQTMHGRTCINRETAEPPRQLVTHVIE